MSRRRPADAVAPTPAPLRAPPLPADVARRLPRRDDALHGVGDPAHPVGRAAVSRRAALARFLADMLDHRAWVGCVPWDLIQPAFMFMVGVSLPYSIASRRAKGQSFGRMLAHSAFRPSCSIALGIFLRSQARAQTYFTFEDVLTQIGLGYVFLFLLAWTRPRDAARRRGDCILVGYWAAFALYPLPAAGIRHHDRRRPRRLAAPRHRLRGALGQEHEPGGPRRPVVPQSVSARAALRLQRRRLPDAELRSLARDDDLRAARRRCAAERPRGTREAARADRLERRRDRCRRRSFICWASARSSSASGRRRGPCSAPAGSRCFSPATTTSST